MPIYKRAHQLFKQFVENLQAEDWVYRHAAEQEPDRPMPSADTVPGTHISSLSLALNQMGILRQSPHVSAIESVRR